MGHIIFMHWTLSVDVTHQHVELTEIPGKKKSVFDNWSGDVIVALEAH